MLITTTLIIGIGIPAPHTNMGYGGKKVSLSASGVVIREYISYPSNIELLVPENQEYIFVLPRSTVEDLTALLYYLMSAVLNVSNSVDVKTNQQISNLLDRKSSHPLTRVEY